MSPARDRLIDIRLSAAQCEPIYAYAYALCSQARFVEALPLLRLLCLYGPASVRHASALTWCRERVRLANANANADSDSDSDSDSSVDADIDVDVDANSGVDSDVDAHSGVDSDADAGSGGVGGAALMDDVMDAALCFRMQALETGFDAALEPSLGNEAGQTPSDETCDMSERL